MITFLAGFCLLVALAYLQMKENRKKDMKDQARSWLSAVRIGFHRLNVSHHADQLEVCLALGNISYEDIGTSKAEVDAMVKISIRNEAKSWLNYLRANHKVGNILEQIAQMDENLRKAGLTRTDIGTSNDEVEQMYQANQANQANQSEKRQ
jgi:Zn-finger domain-containing protein